MWEYREASRLVTLDAVFSQECIYCRTPLMQLPSASFEKEERRLFVQLAICKLCGWWSVYRVHQNEHPRTAGIVEGYSGTIGCLKQLDLKDISRPLDEVRQYLCAREDSLFDVHPRVLEDVVCSIFRDLGWDASTTAYSADGGIDVILDGSDGTTVGIQVKRYKRARRIEAEQIRSLAGAMVQGGHTKGIFVTTSTYRRGATHAAKELTSIGLPIELIDAERFLRMLGIAQQSAFELSQEKAISYVLSKGAHIGSGIHKDFVSGEDLRERPIVAQLFTKSELIELDSNMTFSFSS
ncbi:MAG: restriction endonuclease [Pyrinomonadaceae bacterium]